MHHVRYALPLAVAAVVAACGAPSTGVPVTAKPSSEAALPPLPVTSVPISGWAGLGQPVEPLPAPVATGEASSAPAEAPTPTPRLHEGFEQVPLGAQPADWVDVASEAKLPSWVYPGNWRVVEADGGNRVFLHDDLRVQPAVSFQRYRGTALGTPNGVLPGKYWAELDMKPIRSLYNYPPTGDQGAQLYYVDHAHYVEVVLKPDQLEIWEADGGEPRSIKGWKRLWHRQMRNPAGTARRIGAVVDTQAGTFEAWLDGQPLATVSSPVIKPGPAWLALRGIGNVVSFDEVVIEPR